MTAEARHGRDDLVAALAARIEACFRYGRPDPVLQPDALDEARQLAELTGSRYMSDVEAVMMLATFHLHRWQALPEGRDAWDAEQMRAWLTVAGNIDPRFVPPPLRDVVPRRAPVDESVDVEALNAEASALASAFEQTGNAELLDRGIALWEHAHGQLRYDRRGARATILVNLSGALVMRSEIGMNLQDADDAVAAAREAARISLDGDEIHCIALGHLATALKSRFELRADPADLDEGITVARAAVGDEYRRYGKRPRFLANLANILRLSFEFTGRLSDLDDAVATDREAASEASADDALVIKAKLVGLLHLRFEQAGELADLDEAVDLGHITVDATPEGHPQLAVRLYGLSGALQLRGAFLGRYGDIAEAVRVARLAVAAAGGHHPHRAMCQNNLAAAIRTQLAFGPLLGQAPDPARRDRDLADMIEAARAALAVTPPGHPDRPGHLNNLGVLLRERGHAADLDEVVAVAREAVAITPADHQDRCAHLSNLGNALEARFGRTRRAEDLREAVGAWEKAAASPTGASQVRLAAALAWGRRAAAENDAASAAEGFAVGVSLLPIVAWRGLERAVREENLARSRGAAGDAAAWAIRSGQPERAVEVLEQGRSVLWTQQLHMQTDVDKLAALDEKLKTALEETRRALDSAGRRAGAERDTPIDLDRQAALHSTNAERWDALVAQVRQIEGLQNFLAPVPFRELRAAAADGPVVIVNTSSYGCDALVVEKTGVRVVPLPALDYDEAVSSVDRMLATLGRQDDAADETLTGILSWLWITVAGPVLDALGFTGQLDQAQSRRLWWCPTGVLALLPLHAAGIYGQGHAAVPERVISSYTTTLVALIRARAPRAEPRAAQLLVGVPDAPGAGPLPYVPAELDKIREHLRSATTLTDQSATRERVVRAMADHDWVHLACHGRQDTADPSASSVLLSDGSLSITEIAGRLLPGSELAFLSACQTFTGVPRLSDEAIHLASAFQVAGYRHVIATLWSIHDYFGPRVADRVYQRLTRGGNPDSALAAEAVHAAVAELRADTLRQPRVWAPYVHIGP